MFHHVLLLAHIFQSAVPDLAKTRSTTYQPLCLDRFKAASLQYSAVGHKPGANPSLQLRVIRDDSVCLCSDQP